MVGGSGSNTPLAVPLRSSEDTLAIPHLVPAKGDPRGAAIREPRTRCACKMPGPAATARPQVDPETGNVGTDAVGNAVVAWDNGDTALGAPCPGVPASLFEWLARHDGGRHPNQTVRIPVKATLMGQQAEQIVGASHVISILPESLDTLPTGPLRSVGT